MALRKNYVDENIHSLSKGLPFTEAMAHGLVYSSFRVGQYQDIGFKGQLLK